LYDKEEKLNKKRRTALLSTHRGKEMLDAARAE
jgi:hypothetical protein